jgi:NAD(P)H-dependent FMN reductase
MKIVTIGGSARDGNYTAKALALVQDELRQDKGVDLTAIDPGALRLAIPGTAMDASDRSSLQETIRAADGLVLATPEYHGSFSSLVKLVIESLGFPSALKGKPVVLLGVAAGRIGAIKSLEHLRSVCSHVGAMVLPGSVSVARVQTKFDAEGHCLDAGTERLIRGLAAALVEYIQVAKCPGVSSEERTRNN